MTKVIVLPSPRLPEGTTLPVGLPYVFHGQLSTSWDTVGLFISPEIEPALTFLTDMGNKRRVWLLVGSEKPCRRWVLCGVYATPRGDIDFWVALQDEWVVISAKWSVKQLIVAGDANIHLSNVVQHRLHCSCSHCLQSAVDKKVQSLLSSMGLSCCNPIGHPTHVSGTVVDLLMTNTPSLVGQAEVLPPGSTAKSDHSFVYGEVCAELSYNF